MIVIDTNVVSELTKAAPAPVVKDWILRNDLQLYTTSVTVAEVRYGIGRLPDGRRKNELRSATEGIIADFGQNILSFDVKAAEHYATIVCHREQTGRRIDVLDALIAAICCAHEAPVATRNVKHFEDTGVAVINPWQPGSPS